MGKKSDGKAVWPWEYHHGNPYQWPFGDKHIKKNVGDNLITPIEKMRIK